MALWDQLKWSFRHSKRQLLESILVVVAIALGVGVVITVLAMVLSVGQQYRHNEQAEHFRTLELMGRMESIRRDGAPLTLLGSDVENRDWSATLEELEEFQAHLPSTMHAYTEVHWTGTTPLLPEEDADDESMRPWYLDVNQLYIMGTTPEYFAFNASRLQSGDFFLTDDVRDKNPVIVLPDSLAMELFGDSNPVGQVIPIVLFGDGDPINYTVIGVLEPPESEEGMGFRFGTTRMAYAPITMSPYSPGQGGQRGFNTISIGLDVGVDIATALQTATSEARLIWGDQIALRSSLIEFRASQQQMQRYALLIGVFASVGLVIAVINILNLMLARVLKRTKSIGLSVALGSSRKMVFRQFMMEAFTLGIIGSFFGILLSFALVEILEKALGAFFMTGMWGTRLSLGIAMGLIVSLFFGIYPAYLGSRTNPVDALRTD